MIKCFIVTWFLKTMQNNDDSLTLGLNELREDLPIFRNRLKQAWLCSRLAVSLTHRTFLPVSLNKVFHKIHVAEVHGARVVLVHRGNLRHVFIGQLEVKDFEVLRHAFLVS